MFPNLAKRLFNTTLLMGMLVFKSFGSDKPSVGKVPAWVKPQAIPTTKPNPKDISTGYYEVLIEHQTNIETKTQYFREVRAISTDMGVQYGSEINISFSPNYQQLIVHSIVVRRNNQIINKLEINKFKLILNEEDIKSFIYNGSKTAYLALEDVRVGDLIEYAYSVVGQNPVLGNEYSNTLSFAVSAPVELMYKSIIASSSRALYFRSFNNPPKAVQTAVSAGLTSYAWSLKSPTRFEFEEFEPSWFDATPRIQISTFKEWKDVVGWALPLYQFDQPLSQGLKAKIEQWKKFAATNTFEYTELAVKFVQDEIRYMGFEIGPDSHQPTSPLKVFNQRFGDCKDKALLLVTLLKSNGINAYPVLVNTYLNGHVAEYLPSPYVFNHVIVKVDLDGKIYWIDPTLANQKGSVFQQLTGYYDKALVIKNGETQLQSVYRQEPGELQVVERFKVISEGGEVTLNVESRYIGSMAEEMRSNLTAQGANNLQKNYLDYYAKLYPKAKIDTTSGIRWKDDFKANLFTVFESYRIQNAWERPDSTTKENQLLIKSHLILEQFRKLTNKNRKAPISINFPYEINHTVYIHVPEIISIPPEEFTLNREAYSFSYILTQQDSVVALYYRYEANKDHVAPDKLLEYISDYEKVVDYLTRVYTYTPQNANLLQNSGDTYYLPFVALMLICWGLVGWLATKLYKYSPPSDTPPTQPIPFGGVLYLMAAGMAISPLIFLINVLNFPSIFESFHTSLSNLEPAAFYFFKAILSLNFLFLSAQVVITLLLSILFFKKRNTFPQFFVAYRIGILVYSIITYIAISIITDYLNVNFGTIEEKVTTTVVYYLLGAIIWVPYIYKSSRVKKTFTNPYPILTSPDQASFAGSESENKDPDAASPPESRPSEASEES